VRLLSRLDKGPPQLRDEGWTGWGKVKSPGSVLVGLGSLGMLDVEYWTLSDDISLAPSTDIAFTSNTGTFISHVNCLQLALCDAGSTLLTSPTKPRLRP
jgi:hypothetical protein